MELKDKLKKFFPFDKVIDILISQKTKLPPIQEKTLRDLKKTTISSVVKLPPIYETKISKAQDIKKHEVISNVQSEDVLSIILQTQNDIFEKKTSAYIDENDFKEYLIAMYEYPDESSQIRTVIGNDKYEEINLKYEKYYEKYNYMMPIAAEEFQKKHSTM